MTSFYEDNLNAARHELAHAVLAHMTGHHINGIEYTRTHGCTVIQRPVTPDNLPLAYEQNPISASMAVVQMVAILRVGAYAEVHAGQIGHAPRGQDLLDIEAWRERVVQIGGEEWWARVLSESVRGLQS